MNNGNPPPHPASAKHLSGTKWSVAAGVECEYRHWEVESTAKKDGTVTLFAPLDSSEKITIFWKELRDRTQWEPGWS